MSEFHHAGMTKKEAEATLLPPKTKPVEGRFLFRSSGVEGEYIVSVIFKEKVTHHTLSFQGDTFKLNKKTDLKVGTLEAVHEHLKSKQKPYWPLKLLQGVVCEPVLISNSTVGADVRRQRRVSAGGVDQFKSEKQLMQACYTGQNRMVCELLEVGTNPNCTGDPRDTQNADQGFKPLHLAAINGHDTVTVLLLAADADPACEDKN
eukprot:gene21324-31378_t